jgi:hypothetical protein
MEANYAAALARLPEEDAVRMRAAQLAWITYRGMMCEVEAGVHARRLGRADDALRLPDARVTEARARGTALDFTEVSDERDEGGRIIGQVIRRTTKKDKTHVRYLRDEQCEGPDAVAAELLQGHGGGWRARRRSARHRAAR